MTTSLPPVTSVSVLSELASSAASMPPSAPPKVAAWRADLTASLSVASILLPEAVAYAAIAHLSIQHAITAVLAGLIGYALIGGSRFAVVAPTSSSAALMAAAVLSLHPLSANEVATLSIGLILLNGIGLMLLASARLGRLSAFVSRPVLHGFSFALALTIIIKQLPVALGVSVSAPDPLRLLEALAEVHSQWSINSALVAAVALVLLVLLKRWPRLPGAFLVLALGIVLAYSVNLANYNIASVGPITLNAPGLSLPTLSLERWLNLAALAGGLMIILFAESWGSIRSLALLRNDPAEPNRELFALGGANVLSGLLQGMPVGAGFSASSASYAAGAQSKLTGLFAAFLVLMLALMGKALIEHIPEPVLAAAVISALLHALNPKPLVLLWRLNRDQYLALAAVVAVLMLGVLHGMIVAVVLSLLAAIRSFSQPVVSELAELGDSRNFVVRRNHPSTRITPGTLILRPEEPLFFASVEGVIGEINARLLARPDTHTLVLSLEQSADLDSTAAECLIELARLLQLRGQTLLLARCKDPVRVVLLQLAPELLAHSLFWSVADAAAHEVA